MLPAVSCDVCAALIPPAATACPQCGNRLAAAVQTPEMVDGDWVLSGTRRARIGARATAAAIDGLTGVIVSAPLVMGLAFGTDFTALATTWLSVPLLIALGVAAWVVHALTGRTIGKLALGLRTVDVYTGLPLGLGREMLDRWTGSVVLNVRAGRDPALARSAATPLAARFDPAPGQHPTPIAPISAPPPSPAPSPWQPPAPSSGSAPSPAPAPSSWQTPAPSPAPARSIVIAIDDGQRFEVHGTVLVGRNPEPGPGEKIDALVPLPDSSRSISKTHASLRWDGRTLWVGDRGSTNGTTVVDASGTRQVSPQAPEAAAPGSTVHFGDRSLTVEKLGPIARGAQD